MYEDKLIVTYNEKTKVLYVRTKQTETFQGKIEFGHWYDISGLNSDETLFRVQLIHEGGSEYVLNVEGLEENEQPEGYDIYDILNNQSIKIFKGDLKYIYVELKIQNGEYEYYSKSVQQIPVEMDVDDFADNHARDFYGRFSYSDGDTHYFNGGEVAVRGYNAKEITKAEYKTLQKFII